MDEAQRQTEAEPFRRLLALLGRAASQLTEPASVARLEMETARQHLQHSQTQPLA